MNGVATRTQAPNHGVAITKALVRYLSPASFKIVGILSLINAAHIHRRGVERATGSSAANKSDGSGAQRHQPDQDAAATSPRIDIGHTPPTSPKIVLIWSAVTAPENGQGAAFKSASVKPAYFWSGM